MTAQHTPGPWGFSKYAGRDYGIFPDDSGGELALVRGDHDNEQQLANARLIAAAPELLAALKDAAGILETLGASRNVLRKCNDAIYEAGGRDA